MQSKISIVLPVYNEGESVGQLISEIEKHVDNIEFVVVNDGSNDNSFQVVKGVDLEEGNHLKIVSLARTFGHQIALFAGLCHVHKDADLVVVMDADFQDSPRDIPRLIKRLSSEDLDCVYGVRTANSGNAVLNYTTQIFYKLQKSLFKFPVPKNAGTFCVFNRRFLGQLLQFDESDIYFPGIRAFVGLRQQGVEVTRGARKKGHSKVGLLGLINLSLVGILGFSQIPLRLIFLIGLFTFAMNLIMGLVVLMLKIFSVTTIPGITTLLIVVLAFFGLQMMCIGVLGEYVGKLHMQALGRPRFIVMDVYER